MPWTTSQISPDRYNKYNKELTCLLIKDIFFGFATYIINY